MLLAFLTSPCPVLAVRPRPALVGPLPDQEPPTSPMSSVVSRSFAKLATLVKEIVSVNRLVSPCASTTSSSCSIGTVPQEDQSCDGTRIDEAPLAAHLATRARSGSVASNDTGDAALRGDCTLRFECKTSTLKSQEQVELASHVKIEPESEAQW